VAWVILIITGMLVIVLNARAQADGSREARVAQPIRFSPLEETTSFPWFPNARRVGWQVKSGVALRLRFF
jgi:hypothetical protein